MNELFTDTFKALQKQGSQWDYRSIVEQMRSNDTVFCQSLVDCGYLTQEQMLRAAERYQLGRSRQGGVVFWQIDEQGFMRDGKVMYYRSDCHRDHDRTPSWASYQLKLQGLMPKAFEPQRCLFGLHLLSEELRVRSTSGRILRKRSVASAERLPKGRKKSEELVIAVVEAEKTAVIMSEVFPQYVWMATGGLTMLTVALLRPVLNHRLVLFPDTDPEGAAYARWREVAAEASKMSAHPVYVSDLLERHASAEQKARKIDIVDYVIKEERGERTFLSVN